MNDQKSHLWINLTSGYSQSLNRTTGLESLWQRILHDFDDQPGVRILPPSEWHRDFDDIAAFIKRNSTFDALIIDIAYSWGGGYGQRVYERLRDEHGFTGSSSTVRRYMAKRKTTTREVFIAPAF